MLAVSWRKHESRVGRAPVGAETEEVEEALSDGRFWKAFLSSSLRPQSPRTPFLQDLITLDTWFASGVPDC